MGLILAIVGFGACGVAFSYVHWRSRLRYVVASITISLIGYILLSLAYGDIEAARLAAWNYVVDVVVYHTGPWLLFAVSPMQLGYFAARQLRSESKGEAE